jgi:hypothetical protein
MAISEATTDDREQTERTEADAEIDCSGCDASFDDPVSKQHHELHCLDTGNHTESDAVNQGVDRALQYVSEKV